MNEMQVFQNSEFGELGVLEIEGKPYFPANRCAKVLGYHHAHALRSRTPHGVRGLKCAGQAHDGAVSGSHPARGAWIEISALTEIPIPQQCRTPHGVRGLK